MLRTLRASSMPLAFLCGASVTDAALPINESNGAALLGTAAHEALRSLAERGAIDWDALPALAARYSVPVEDLRVLCALATKLWPELAPSFPEALTEVSLSCEVAPGAVLSGHLDLLSVAGEVARAGDWKTGRKDSDYGQQMRAYAALVLLDSLDLSEVTVTVIWVREGEIENYTMRRADLAPWLDQLRSEVVEWNGVYRPGTHCVYCPRSHECAAANAMVRRDVAAIADRDLLGRAENELSSMPAGEIVALLRKADTVSRYAERVRQAIKAHVIANGDIVADGARITLDTETRRELDTAAAWPVLERAGFGDEEFAQVVELRVSKVEKVAAKRAGRGGGAAAVRELSAALSAAGAVEVREIQKLALKRA